MATEEYRYEGIDPEVEEDGEAHLEEKLEADEEFRRAWESNRAKRELGTLLLEKRLELGISQRELADRVGTSQNRVYLMENGEANPTLETLQRLVGVLRFTLVIKPRELVAG
jgi:ribosome-binding protein aMBF1 (putative translation factor)